MQLYGILQHISCYFHTGLFFLNKTDAHMAVVRTHSASKDHTKTYAFWIFFFSFGVEANSATFSCMSLFSACQNTISRTQKNQTAPAPRAMIASSIKSNSATVAHFKVNLSQHFDIFKNKACQVYFRSSFELLPQWKGKKGNGKKNCPFDQTISVQISRKRALRIYAVSKTSPKSIHSDVREVMAPRSAAVNHRDILGLTNSCSRCSALNIVLDFIDESLF